ncbi:unnamed protein product [Brassica oleracea var. botrytis]|uniref:(rape) hypothetical protein n=1 Tax=Brassica napus TaxID=3708 RepID=A0A816JJK8_BRANA|nr:unnamed protein product [Brassica napus]
MMDVSLSLIKETCGFESIPTSFADSFVYWALLGLLFVCLF